MPANLNCIGILGVSQDMKSLYVLCSVRVPVPGDEGALGTKAFQVIVFGSTATIWVRTLRQGAIAV